MTQIIFEREVLIYAPLVHVWQLVATESGLRQWWGNTIFLEAKVGGRCEEWRPAGHKTAHWQGVVTQYTPPHHLLLTLRAQEPQADGPELTTISIALESKREQTRVYVTQRAFGPASVVGTQDPRETFAQPDRPQSVPLAQLDQPAPGSLPMPVPQMPTTGQIDPSYNLFTRQQADALTLSWQRRLTNLAAAITQTDTQ